MLSCFFYRPVLSAVCSGEIFNAVAYAFSHILHCISGIINDVAYRVPHISGCIAHISGNISGRTPCTGSAVGSRSGFGAVCGIVVIRSRRGGIRPVFKRAGSGSRAGVSDRVI